MFWYREPNWEDFIFQVLALKETLSCPLDNVPDRFKLPHRTWSPGSQIEVHEDPHMHWIDSFVLCFHKEEPKGKKTRQF